MKARNYVAQTASLTLHGLGLLALLLFMNRTAVTDDAAPPPAVPSKLVYVVTPDVLSGGGGGGAPAPAAPVSVEIPKPRPLAIVPIVSAAPADPPPAIDAPVMTNPTAMLTASGVDGKVAVPFGGGGKNGGIGPGDGPGLGPGNGPGFDGTGRAGVGGIEPPVRLREEKPQYTPEAMRAKVQGPVELEGIVDVAGHVTDVRVVKSLDRIFGLDEQARRAALKTPFLPCKKAGTPVACVVTFQLDFVLR